MTLLIFIPNSEDSTQISMKIGVIIELNIFSSVKVTLVQNLHIYVVIVGSKFT